MKVAVTGGSGVVGRAVVRHLVEDGHNVRALARSDEANAVVESLGAEPIRGDILSAPTLFDLVDGARWVFHVAGVNEMCATSPALMDRVNIEGTGSVIDACRVAGVERLIHTSSAVTIGEEPGALGSESTVHRGTFISRYERSKYLAERRLFEEAGSLDVISVNPSSVQGPGRATGTGKLILDVINGRMQLLVDTSFSIVDIDDCARGHLLAAKNGLPGERYILSGSTVDMREAVGLFQAVSGRVLSVRYAPGWLVRAGAGIIEFGARLTGRTPPVCREMVAVMLAGARYDGTRASRDLGLSYSPLEDTIRRMFAWFETENLLT